MPETSFEDLLVVKPRCKTCRFLEPLDEPLKSQIIAALGKAKFSDAVIARGMATFSTDANPSPSEEVIRKHRQQGHVA